MEEDMKIPNHVAIILDGEYDAQKLWTCTGGKDGGGDL